MVADLVEKKILQSLRFTLRFHIIPFILFFPKSRFIFFIIFSIYHFSILLNLYPYFVLFFTHTFPNCIFFSPLSINLTQRTSFLPYSISPQTEIYKSILCFPRLRAFCTHFQPFINYWCIFVPLQ